MASTLEMLQAQLKETTAELRAAAPPPVTKVSVACGPDSESEDPGPINAANYQAMTVQRMVVVPGGGCRGPHVRLSTEERNRRMLQKLCLYCASQTHFLAMCPARA